MDWAKTTTRRDEEHLSFGIWCGLYQRFYGSLSVYFLIDSNLRQQYLRWHMSNIICGNIISITHARASHDQIIVA